MAWALQWVQDIHRFEDAIALIPKVAVQELDGLKRKDPCSEGTAKHQLQHATYKMQQITTCDSQVVMARLRTRREWRCAG